MNGPGAVRRLVAALLAGATLAALGIAGFAGAQPGVPSPAASAAGQVSGAAGRCGVCHPAERTEFETSRHAGEQVRCVSCHGGNDGTLEQARAHGGNFRGRIPRRSVPGVCAGCHSDQEKMRAYNLPVDQFALYQTSVHGQKLAKGDERVAVCSDCHGAHAILAASDPASRVFRTNVPQTCGGCHADSTRTGRNVFDPYVASVHGRELIDNANPRAPNCVSCHGAHGAAPPEVGDVGKVCGQCHTAERRYFTAGPHVSALGRGGTSECATCHGDHGIQKAPPEWLGAVCADCHAADSPEHALGERLWTAYRSAHEDLEKADGLIERAERVPLVTEDYRARLEQGRTYLNEALTAAHSIDEETVSGFTARARSVGTEIQSEIYAKLGNLNMRRLLLIVFWFYLILTVLVLRRFRDASRSA